jgi:hypothetical protein
MMRKLLVLVIVALVGCPTTTPVVDAGVGEGEGDAAEGEGDVSEGEGEVGEGEGDVGEGEGERPPPYAISTKNQLAWKRHIALEQDLSTALSLPANALCNELGLYSCVRAVHTVPLGGNDPFVKSQYEPLPRPTVTTPIAVDRVVLSACMARATLDATATPVVFSAIDFSAAEVSEANASTTLSSLSRRLLQRDLTEAELTRALELRVDDAGAAVSPRDFAVLSCFAVGTLTETLMY